ncbi:FxLYD domain-containing protein [Natronorubrum sulfidifaciens]|nr:FxLYD domain-containing protein [Natronorubrum sulfidifaciens]
MLRSTCSRRRVLTVVGAGATAALAGCNDGGVGSEPEYEAGSVGSLDGENRSATEMTAAESLAQQETNDGVTPLEAVTITDHEFVLESDYRGSTVQGTVENTSDDRIELLEVRVRVYDDSGAQLGQFLDSVGDLAGEASWSFQVVILKPPSEITDYDISVLGTPT